ncbi:MAG: DNA polymerase III subunit gamma/tau [Oscillospiraceae bacterium]|nr:DNA polymerase III subunit gamma/tau [Oscillospiraceae bacterium]
MYQALYRKWRPKTFDEVIGQQHITEPLKNQVAQQRLSHAYLFIGTRGTGKTTCARILARAVNCENPQNGNPCGVCPACRGIMDGSILDVVELDAASNNGVDNVRALREEAVFSPASVKKRVYIIDEVHMLSAAAFNALLKILEEPPEHLMFILATTELNKVPATILSRCQRHSFKRIDAPVIAEYLEYIARRESISLTHEAAELIARLAEGGVRDALSLLDQCSAGESIGVEQVYSSIGLAGKRRIAELMDKVLRHDAAGAAELFSELWMDGKDPATLLGELSQLLRDVLMLTIAPKGGVNLLSGGFDEATLRSVGSKMTREELLCSLQTLQNAQSAMRTVNNPRMNAELCLVSLCDDRLGDSTAQLRARLSRLEELAKNGRFSAPAEPVEAEETAKEPETEPDVAPEEPEFRAASAEQTELPGKTELLEETAEGAAFWDTLVERVKPQMPPSVRAMIGDPKMLLGTVAGDVLRLDISPNFAAVGLRQEHLEIIRAAASELCGRQLRLVTKDLPSEGVASRSIEDLRQFKVIQFINEDK